MDLRDTTEDFAIGYRVGFDAHKARVLRVLSFAAMDEEAHYDAPPGTGLLRTVINCIRAMDAPHGMREVTGIEYRGG